MEIENITFNEQLELPPEHKDIIVATLQHEREPFLLKEGRSPYVRLDALRLEPVRFRRIYSYCLKLKGGGHVKKENGKMTVVAPNEAEYFGQQFSHDFFGMTIHTGTDEHGHILPIIGRPRVMGGLEYTAAENEYHITKGAVEKGVPVCLPVAYGKYALRLDDAEIGFVVLGARDSLDRRVGDLFLAEMIDSTQIRLPTYLYDQLRKPMPSQKDIVDFFNRLHFKQGKNLYAFHCAGFARHAGHSGNYQIDEHTGAHVLLDLDSSIRNRGKAAFLTRTLDVMSALRGVHEAACRTVLALVGENNPYQHFLQGYFPCQKKRTKKLISKAAQVLLDEFTRPYRGIPVDQFHRVRNSFTVVAIPIAYELMEASKPKGIRPPYGQEQLKKELSLYVDKFNVINGGSSFHEMVDSVVKV